MMIPYGRQDIIQKDIDAVIEVLQSEFLTQGPKVPLFEKTIATKVGANHCLAVNSATSALHIACIALGLGEGDSLWTSPITFVASANCGLYCGAKIDFVDIDPITYNLCPKALEAKLLVAKREGNLPKVLVAVHLCGQPCDMRSIHALSERYGFKIIEDASHAIGASYLGESVGNCRYSDITVFSFHPVKIITTAEGGMALTNDNQLADKMNLCRSHGITRDEHLMTHESDGPWYYQQIDIGFNYRMTDLQAALGVSQMTRLDNFIDRRRSIAGQYDYLLKNLSLKIPFQNSEVKSSFHLYVIRLKLDKLQHTKKYIFEFLRKQGIGVNLHYIPVHTHPYFQKMGFRSNDFPEAKKYYEEAISLPIYHGMSDEQQNFIVEKLTEVCS
jgi:UDP-4-amino-4,6-dideoxy-N-acetyl-beta-L-altrosamine transaminase